MKLLSLSGGATKFVGILSCGQGAIDSGFKPTHIAGVSAGAIAALPLALGIYETAKEKGLNLSLKDMFTKLPVNNKGNFSLGSICRLVLGKTSLGVQDITPMLKKFIPEYLFAKYKNEDYPICLFTAVDYTSGSRTIFNAKECSYNECIQAIRASSNIPILAQPIEINGTKYFDGGVRDHNPGSCILSKIEGFTEVVSVYSRPQNNEEYNSEWDSNFLGVLSRTLDIMQIEISKTDEQLEKQICREKNIALKQLFLEPVMKSLFDMDKTRLVELSNKSYEIGKNIYT